MKHFEDGDQLCITRDDFINLQESPAIFFPLGGDIAQTIIDAGFLALPLSDLIYICDKLQQHDDH